MRDWELARDLATPFPARFIQRAPRGKYGSYINHADITQRLLAIHGPYSFEVTQIIRGHAPGIATEKNEWPAREDAILGCLGTLTILDSDHDEFVITEVGTEDNPAMGHDAENLKNAASDAFKRCAMRLGLGLELWAKEGFHLPAQLEKLHGVEPLAEPEPEEAPDRPHDDSDETDEDAEPGPYG